MHDLTKVHDPPNFLPQPAILATLAKCNVVHPDVCFVFYHFCVFFVFYIVSSRWSIPHPPPSDPIPYHRIHLYLYNVDSIFSYASSSTLYPCE